ncbi:MAG: NfeD family protein [Alcanivoracaceae bacterium]|nr:NfeD family protein [Alcanivoracaceae bacterium]
MIEWLYDLDFHHWILLGLLLLVIEVFIGGGFFMWIGFSAVALGLLVLMGPLVGIHLSWQWQLSLFGLGALLALYAWRRYVRDPVSAEGAGLNRRGADLVGKVTTLKTDLRNGQGYVSVYDTRWRVTGPDLDAGTRVRLVSMDDMTFTVEPVDQDQ